MSPLPFNKFEEAHGQLITTDFAALETFLMVQGVEMDLCRPLVSSEKSSAKLKKRLLVSTGKTLSINNDFKKNLPQNIQHNL